MTIAIGSSYSATTRKKRGKLPHRPAATKGSIVYLLKAGQVEGGQVREFRGLVKKKVEKGRK